MDGSSERRIKVAPPFALKAKKAEKATIRDRAASLCRILIDLLPLELPMAFVAQRRKVIGYAGLKIGSKAAEEKSLEL